MIEQNIVLPTIQKKISSLENHIQNNICSTLPNAFWSRKKHIVDLPHELDFSEKDIPNKVRPTQMKHGVLNFCQKEIQDLLNKGLIRKSQSHWSCSAFYVNKNAELEREVPRLFINYKSLNKALKWIRYPIPNKKDLLNRLRNSKIFSKFDMKSGFWQI